MALNYSAGFLGQAQAAPDSSLTPGTYAALSETGHWTLDPSANEADASVYLAEGVGKILTTRDPVPGIDGIYDFGDGGLTNIIQSCFPVIIGSPYVPSTRLWLRLLDAAAKGTELSTFVSELGISSDDPNNLTKFSAKFGFDGQPDRASMFTAISKGSPHAPLAYTAAGSTLEPFCSPISRNDPMYCSWPIVRP